MPDKKLFRFWNYLLKPFRVFNPHPHPHPHSHPHPQHTHTHKKNCPYTQQKILSKSTITTMTTRMQLQNSTSKVKGHTEQAAKDARWQCFAMLDFFGLNSLFMITTPDDECSSRVRLYCKPHNWVSLHRKSQIGIIRFL